ncbi:MAG: hypothetical protein IPN26_11150 [Bacteroidetes bacterium]|nr:hypothetical protein [Bacteroidota bacterium]
MKFYFFLFWFLGIAYNSMALNIVKIEYFFDNDPGFGNGTSAPITPGSNIANLNINADVSALPSGIHQLYVRCQDANGQWSITNRSFSTKPKTAFRAPFRTSLHWNIFRQ